jgi:hypothetical protein
MDLRASNWLPADRAFTGFSFGWANGFPMEHIQRLMTGAETKFRPCESLSGAVNYRFEVPRTSFFTLRFAEPRAYSRGLSGVSVAFFLRAVRFAFLRSSLVSFLVFAMNPFQIEEI